MSPELDQAAAQIHEPFTTEEYLKIRELGGYAFGALLDKHPCEQVTDFCKIAENEFGLHGDQSFIRKSLDAALERVASIDGSYIHPSGYPRRVDLAQQAAYLEIATTAYSTEQAPEYVSVILGVALAGALENDSDRQYETETVRRLEKIAETAHKTGQHPQFIKNVADRIYDLGRDEPSAEKRFNGIIDLFAKAADNWELDEDYQSDLIERAHGEARAIEDAEQRVIGLFYVAALYLEGTEQPDKTRATLEEAHQEISSFEDSMTRAGYLTILAEASQKTEQPDDYAKGFLKQALQEVLGQEADPETTIHNVQEILTRSLELLHPEIEEELIGPGLQVIISGIKDSDSLSARDKHKLLNRALGLVGKAEITEDFLEANGIVKRPFNFAFNTSE